MTEQTVDGIVEEGVAAVALIATAYFTQGGIETLYYDPEFKRLMLITPNEREASIDITPMTAAVLANWLPLVLDLPTTLAILLPEDVADLLHQEATHYLAWLNNDKPSK